MTLNFSQFLKPVFSLPTKYLHMFFPSSWNAHFTLFYLINSYDCSELLNEVLLDLLASSSPLLYTLTLAPSLAA